MRTYLTQYCLVMLTAFGLDLRAQEIVFPDDPKAVVDLKRDCGAKGDGVADDTESLQQAIYKCTAKDFTRTIYIPNGTYKITRTIIFKPNEKGGEGAMVGPWFYGQNREKTIIKLADNADGFGDPAKPKEAIRTLSRADGARMNADFFDRTLVNFTIDTGNNPGAIGIKYYSNNTGLMKDVLIKGNGVCGIDLARDQNGPHLIQDVEIEGFETGLKTGAGINSQTISRITIRKAKVGLLHRGQVFSAEALRVEGVPLAVDSDEGVLTLVDCKFTAPNGTEKGTAIKLGPKGFLYVQRLSTTGFTPAISAQSAPNKDAIGPEVAEYSSHPTKKVDASAPESGLCLKAPPEPMVSYETDPKKWVCANEFGATFGDENDDADALQKAIDHAAEIGATTVYLRGGKGGDPNWYWIKKDVKVHGSVNRIWGFGFIRLLGGPSADPKYPENLAKFVVEDDPKGAPVVVFEHLQVFAPWPSFGIENRSTKRIVVCQTIGGTVIGRPNSTTFMTNCVGHAYVEKGASLYIRQWNTEGGPKAVKVNTRNDGGTLWALGMKTEAASTKVQTLNGGQTEILGTLNYNTSGVSDETPFFAVENSTLSVSAYREICFVGKWWKVPVYEKVAGTEHKLSSSPWMTWSLLRVGK